MIELKNITCSFPEKFFSKSKFTAVSSLNVEFKKQERYAIVGESGCGKTTIARVIAGLHKPSSGNVFVEGEPVYGTNKKILRRHYKKVQIIQQNSLSALDPKMTIGSAIEEPLICFFRMHKVERRKRCIELMKICNLPVDYIKKFPSELSGGEQKRVAIARAIAVMPECLIFDEATNGFDLPLRKKIINEIIHLQASIGFTLIFITHDIELAITVADKILVMKNSKLLENVGYFGDISAFKNDYSRMLLKSSGVLG